MTNSKTTCLYIANDPLDFIAAIVHDDDNFFVVVVLVASHKAGSIQGLPEEIGRSMDEDIFIYF